MSANPQLCRRGCWGSAYVILDSLHCLGAPSPHVPSLPTASTSDSSPSFALRLLESPSLRREAQVAWNFRPPCLYPRRAPLNIWLMGLGAQIAQQPSNLGPWLEWLWGVRASLSRRTAQVRVPFVAFCYRGILPFLLCLPASLQVILEDIPASWKVTAQESSSHLHPVLPSFSHGEEEPPSFNTAPRIHLPSSSLSGVGGGWASGLDSWYLSSGIKLKLCFSPDAPRTKLMAETKCPLLRSRETFLSAHAQEGLLGAM